MIARREVVALPDAVVVVVWSLVRRHVLIVEPLTDLRRSKGQGIPTAHLYSKLSNSHMEDYIHNPELKAALS